VIRRRCPAKLNILLQCGPAGANGYHPIDSLVCLIDLCDELILRPRSDEQIALTCDDAAIPTDETNLAMRAARAMPRPAGACGVDIALRKRIPAGAGLGGGSSDAAATLAGLNELWGAGLSRNELGAMAAAIGSDVALFLNDDFPARITGRGEIVTPVHAPLDAWVVLILPKVHCPTAEIYRTFDTLPPPPVRPSVDRLISACTVVDARGGPQFDVPRLMEFAFNDLLPAAVKCRPELDDLLDLLTIDEQPGPHMTGSGSALFALHETREGAEAQAADCRKLFSEASDQRLSETRALVTRTLPSAETDGA
jgi:4-diphosphocytidyl-2-C-methyl-D-erythritol kinase